MESQALNQCPQRPDQNGSRATPVSIRLSSDPIIDRYDSLNQLDTGRCVIELNVDLALTKVNSAW